MADDHSGPRRHRHFLQPVEHGPRLRQHHLQDDQSEDQDGLSPSQQHSSRPVRSPSSESHFVWSLCLVRTTGRCGVDEVGPSLTLTLKALV